MILEEARPQDVLLWQRVNKTWQAVIQRSPRIQEKLFFKVRPCKDKDEEERAALNPFMDIFLCYDQPRFALGKCSVEEDAFGGEANYPTASWRQMLISTPAITQLEFLRSASFHEGDWRDADAEYKWSISCKSGVTIGQLAKTYEEWSLKCYDAPEYGKPTAVSDVFIRNLEGKPRGSS